MLRRPFIQPVLTFFAGLGFRARLLGGLALLFFLLVAFGIHGSATGVTAAWWAPEKPYTGYLATPPQSLSRMNSAYGQSLFWGQARHIRWDEYLVSTPLALSQLSHRPRFPVVNTNIGDGQNVLISFHAPVWHITALARPSTWGYFFLGARRGLAWHWWFQVFACFAALFLLFEIILRGHSGLAAFGAFWFCGSAYVVCWSLWPALITFFAALGCLSAYHLLRSERPSIRIINGVLLGLSIPGFVMCIYPPWQVPVGHLFLFLLIGLFIRDKLYRAFLSLSWPRLLSILIALILAGGLVASFYVTCREDFRVMSDTLYPGKRVSLGGDHSFAQLFKGMYNLITIYQTPGTLNNESEAASFYYLFPAAVLGILLSRRLLKRLSVVGWLLVAYLAGMMLFLLAGVPESIARLTLISYVPPYRADIAIGLASIILCMCVLALAKESRQGDSGKWERLVPWIVSALTTLLFLLHGLTINKLTERFLSKPFVMGVSLVAGLLAYCLVAGRARAFCGAMGVVIVATTALFNPLATNLDHIYESELAREIVRLNNQPGERPLWLSYESADKGALLNILGCRSLSGVHWPPQLALWQKLDPNGIFRHRYNRYAEVQLNFEADENKVFFRSPKEDQLRLQISPKNPLLKELGARYVLVSGNMVEPMKSAGLSRVFRSANKAFYIFEIPSGNNGQNGRLVE